MSESGNWSAPDRFSGEDVELIDEIVLSEDILDDDGGIQIGITERLRILDFEDAGAAGDDQGGSDQHPAYCMS